MPGVGRRPGPLAAAPPGRRGPPGRAGLAINYSGNWDPYRVTGIVDWGWENGFGREPWVRMNEAFIRHGPVKVNPMAGPFLTAQARGCGPCMSRAELVPDAAWYRSAFFRDFQAPSGGDTILYCDRPLPQEGGSRFLFVLVRPPGERDFSPRQRAVVREVHAAVTGLVGGPLAAWGDPAPSALPPRTRQVLRRMLTATATSRSRLPWGSARTPSTSTLRRSSRTSASRGGWPGRAAWCPEPD